MDEEGEELPSEDFDKRIANLANAVVALIPRFRNVRKICSRLLGDVPEAALDALVSRLRLYSTRNQAEAIRIAVEQSGLPPSHVLDAFSKQESLDKVIASALLHVAIDTDDTSSSNENSGSTGDDWFDVFRREAADRSAGEMREAFSRILAGEILQPGTFSVQSLRILGALSISTAASFRRAASVCIHSTIQQDARIPAVGGELGQNCLKDMALSYDTLMELTENGLLRPEFNCYMPYGPISVPASQSANQAMSIQLPFTHQGRHWILQPLKDELKGKQLRVEGAALSSAGRELLSIVELEDIPQFTERLKAHFAKSRYKMVEVSKSDAPIANSE